MRCRVACPKSKITLLSYFICGSMYIFKPFFCNSTKECKDFFGKSLFVVGEFGGNDYNALLFAGQGLDMAYKFMPYVIQGITDGIGASIAERQWLSWCLESCPQGASLFTRTCFKSQLMNMVPAAAVSAASTHFPGCTIDISKLHSKRSRLNTLM